MNSKLLIVLQYWQGDRAMMQGVAKLIADLEDTKSSRADILLAPRFDCEVDKVMLEALSRKFDVLTHVGRRQATGWPFGPNELWFDVAARLYERCSAGKWPRYKAVLTTEADTAPLCRNWIDRLHQAWDLNEGGGTVNMMGSFQPKPGPHINGNCLISGSLPYLKWLRDVGGCSPTGGWDYLLAGKFREKGVCGLKEIRSYWRFEQECTPELVEMWREAGVVWFHGCKDGSIIRAVRQLHFSSPQVKLPPCNVVFGG